MIRKGKIVNVYSDDKMCRVESLDVPGDISGKLKVQEGITFSELKKDDVVVYTVFDDQTGMVLGRM